MTLLELSVILAIVGVIFFITLPTLRPQGSEAAIEFTKEQLRYLHAREQEYFALHGKYAPLSQIAKDPELGRRFDQRFNQDEAQVNGVKFIGPKVDGLTYEIAAILPKDAGRYRIDQTGQVTAY
jgi:type II secretory pathway pseudopilin PulG